MFFKSMEIYGFKSFPDRTVLNFDKKMTAVVGSNGNGKSNISDALRWVMGEQGAKSLRGDKMEDVIFHGTQRRKAMGFAKVALTIDNTDRALNIDSDEVVISRKLYRSGESEYMINGGKTLLKNINELFMGTGLGRDGYSVVGQGRVAEIVESAGSKRREVFEEAAGVSKFLAQKKDAENKLKRAEDNLLRIRDIATELEERLPVLERQAAKAKKAKLLVDREQELAISLSVYDLSAAEKAIGETEDKILLNKAEVENLDRDIEKLEAEQEQQNALLLSLRAELETLREKGDKAKELISDIKSETAVMENDIRHLTEQIESLNKNIEESKSGKEKLEQDKQQLLKEIDEIRADIQRKNEEAAKLSEQLTGLSAQGEALDEEYKELDRAQGQLYLRRTQLQLQIEQSETSAQDIDKRRDELNASVEQLEGSIVEHKQKLKEINRELEAAEEKKQETENKLGGYRQLFANRSEKLTNASKTLESLQKEYETKRQRYTVLDDIDKSMAGFGASVKSVMGAYRRGQLSGICGTVADIITVDAKYTVAIETTLGGVLQNIVVNNEDAAKRSMRYLKDNNLGRATFLPLTSVKGKTLEIDGLEDEDGFEGMASELVGFDEKYDGVIRFILGKTAVAEDIDCASYIAKKYGYRFRIVTLDGQIINAGGSFTGGSVKTDAGIISRKQELTKLEKDTERLSEKIAKENEALKPLKAEVAKLTIELEGYDEILAGCEPEIARLTAQADGEKMLIKQFNAQLDAAAEQLDRLELSVDEQAKLKEEYRKQLDVLLVEIGKNSEELLRRESDISARDSGKKDIADKISALNIDILESNKDIDAINIKAENIDNSIKALTDGGTDYQQRIEEHTKEIEEIRERIAKRLSDSEKLNTEQEQSEKEISANITKSNAAEARISAIHTDIRELTEAKEKFGSELARQEERKRSSDEQIEKIVTELWDKYEMTRSEALGKYEVPEDVPGAKTELAKLRRDISALGNVNYSSIEELEEVQQRYGVLSKQLSDVETSKRELEKLIDNLIKDIKQRFTESFNAINDHFGRLFTEIFGGGEARLQLADPDDVLGSDVEIYAAPPGKVIKTLTSLSGGEKAMVALTIYLAILLHRPTPFCMLDEVDAALDEINVQKYATYLKRFSRDTQLMVITHRRGTIELCDVLYGVFMQEKGVSGLLKQELTDDIDAELD
ncbi:MAG: chromosome segregation protein SMC [Eubacterium sp.]|nr:chromosome segregation protein SMC [Eubacterium sp.]